MPHEGKYQRRIKSQRPYGGEVSSPGNRKVLDKSGVSRTRLRSHPDGFRLLFGGPNQLRDSLEVGRRAHIPETEGSSPSPATSLGGGAADTLGGLV